jgi:selenocysteine lyase/cysteine desulfurase
VIEEIFPITEKMIYFNTAVMGCLPGSTIDIIEEYTRNLAMFLREDTGWDGTLQSLEDRKPGSKKVFAKLIGASHEEIACVPNATAGMNTITSMIPMKRGDNIVTTDLVFPMGAVVVNHQRRRGAETRFIKGRDGIVETSDFDKAVDDDTAIIYIDHAGWFNGLLFDLRAIADIAHEHGAHLVVDATQSFGAVKWDMDMSGVDAAATSTYKWLMGGIWSISTGFMYINSELLDAYPPAYVSGASMEKR